MPAPLYVNAATIEVSGNLGLLFDKLANKWTFDSKVEFDKANWINQFAKSVGDLDELGQYAVRYLRLITALGGTLVGLKNTTRFVTGTGLQHPMENGFAWHRILGVPYLPSSGFKGAVKGAIIDSGSSSKYAHQTSEWFGNPTQVGGFCFFDLVPVRPPRLCVEILTPHYSDYYQDGKTPGDWINPVPIPFLAVEAKQSWIVGVAPTSRRTKLSVNDLRAAAIEVVQAYGLGAKTSIGMGGFEESCSEISYIADVDQSTNLVAILAQECNLNDPQVQEILKQVQQTADDDVGGLRKIVREFLTIQDNISIDLCRWITTRILKDKFPKIIEDKLTKKIEDKKLAYFVELIIENVKQDESFNP